MGGRPNGGGGGTVDNSKVLSLIGDNDVLHTIDPTTDSVCEVDGTGLSGGKGRKVSGGDIIVYRLQMGLLGRSD